jgi:hypothetical protein
MGIFLYNGWDGLQPFCVVCGVILSNNSMKSFYSKDTQFCTRNQRKESWGISSLPENNVNCIKFLLESRNCMLLIFSVPGCMHRCFVCSSGTH